MYGFNLKIPKDLKLTSLTGHNHFNKFHIIKINLVVNAIVKSSTLRPYICRHEERQNCASDGNQARGRLFFSQSIMGFPLSSLIQYLS